MFVRSLLLDQFRSYNRLELKFDEPQIELFLGPNGSGKTNVLEAMSFLSAGKSFLKAEIENVIHWEKNFFRVTAQIESDEGEKHSLQCFSEVKPRRCRAFFVNDIRRPAAAFTGFLPTVTFLPEDLGLFTGSPGRRRDFLDDLIVQLNPEWQKTFVDYDAVHRQRNSLLKRIAEGRAKEADLDPWDEQLSVLGSLIQAERMMQIQRLNAVLFATLQSVGERWKDVELEHARKRGEETESTELVSDDKLLAQELKLALKERRSKEVIIGFTTVGPHRDDWQLCANRRNIATFASRGQQRVSLLALLFAALELFHDVRGEKPVVLLDDVFSELDDDHQAQLFSVLKGYQVFITATHLPKEIGEGRVWEMKNFRK